MKPLSPQDDRDSSLKFAGACLCIRPSSGAMPQRRGRQAAEALPRGQRMIGSVMAQLSHPCNARQIQDDNGASRTVSWGLV